MMPDKPSEAGAPENSNRHYAIIKKCQSDCLDTFISRQILEKHKMSAPGDSPTNTLQTFHHWLFQKS
jgi:hypothetical protein